MTTEATNAAQQADTSEPQYDDTVPEHDGSFTRLTAGQPYRSEPQGLGRLDAHGLAQLRAIVAQVIHQGHKVCAVEGCTLWHPWRFIFDMHGNPKPELTAAFCDAVSAAIVAAAAPATQAKGGPQR